jgi:hypothetical protein
MGAMRVKKKRKEQKRKEKKKRQRQNVFYGKFNTSINLQKTGVFDREYTLSLDKLTEGEESLLCTIDAAPSLMTLYCRHYFKQLNV